MMSHAMQKMIRHFSDAPPLLATQGLLAQNCQVDRSSVGRVLRAPWGTATPVRQTGVVRRSSLASLESPATTPVEKPSAAIALKALKGTE